MKTIRILGVGELAEKRSGGLIEADPDVKILLSPRNTVRAKTLSEILSCAMMSSNQEVIVNADTIVIGVKSEALAPLSRQVTYRSGWAVFSLAASVNLKKQNLFAIPGY